MFLVSLLRVYNGENGSGDPLAAIPYVCGKPEKTSVLGLALWQILIHSCYFPTLT